MLKLSAFHAGFQSRKRFRPLHGFEMQNAVAGARISNIRFAR